MWLGYGIRNKSLPEQCAADQPGFREAVWPARWGGLATVFFPKARRDKPFPYDDAAHASAKRIRFCRFAENKLPRPETRLQHG